MRTAIFVLNDYSLEVARSLIVKFEAELFNGKRDFKTLGELVTAVYRDYDALIFVMAAGIAVRVLAPLLKNKAQDPAVLVIDPRGQFVISLLSGHLGGANRLAGEVAAVLGATPVITTATDVLGKKSVEDWAEHFELGIGNLNGLVKINGALVRGERLTVYTELTPSYFDQYPLTETGKIDFLPLSKLGSVKSSGTTIVISRPQTGCSGRADLHLIIRNLVVGVGCRRGASKSQIKEFLRKLLIENGLSLQAIRKLASIDLKRTEPGLVELARELEVPVVFFSSQELAQIFSDYSGLSYSKFVQKQVGVGGVCEPAAILGSKQGSLIIKKQWLEGVTLAVAEEKLPLWV